MIGVTVVYVCETAPPPPSVSGAAAMFDSCRSTDEKLQPLVDYLLPTELPVSA